MDYGMKDKNPINNVHFYCKNDLAKAIQIRKNQVRTEERSHVGIAGGFFVFLTRISFLMHSNAPSVSNVCLKIYSAAAVILVRCLNFFRSSLLSS